MEDENKGIYVLSNGRQYKKNQIHYYSNILGSSELVCTYSIGAARSLFGVLSSFREAVTYGARRQMVVSVMCRRTPGEACTMPSSAD